jgi:hypothetical protein
LCVAINLLDLQEIKQIVLLIENTPDLESFAPKEKATYVAGLFQNVAKQKNIELKLRKKK